MGRGGGGTSLAVLTWRGKEHPRRKAKHGGPELPGALTAMGLGAEATPSPDSHTRGADDSASYSRGPREEPEGWVHVHPLGQPLLAARSP